MQLSFLVGIVANSQVRTVAVDQIFSVRDRFHFEVALALYDYPAKGAGFIAQLALHHSGDRVIADEPLASEPAAVVRTYPSTIDFHGAKRADQMAGFKRHGNRFLWRWILMSCHASYGTVRRTAAEDLFRSAARALRSLLGGPPAPLAIACTSASCPEPRWIRALRYPGGTPTQPHRSGTTA